MARFECVAHVKGRASGRLVGCGLELSFWGGVDPQTGEIIDRHHSLNGRFVNDGILAIPSGRGSCSGSGVLLELLLNGHAPRGLIFARNEEILTLGVLIAEELFGKTIPVVTLKPDDFEALLSANYVQIDSNRVSAFRDKPSQCLSSSGVAIAQSAPLVSSVWLTEGDKAILRGSLGVAAQVAMRIILRVAALLGSDRLLDIDQVHVDGRIYTGPGSLAFAEKLRDWGGQVAVLTTLNSISVDQLRWRSQGIESSFGDSAEKLAAAYTDMGARPTFTCAPYLLESAPAHGSQIAWAESNAVVYANSVLGARTMKYPDFLDIMIALTGRAPDAGLHKAKNRLATLRIDVSSLSCVDHFRESLYPLLGYCVGKLAGNQIPVITGLCAKSVTTDDLKAFGAAYATTSSAPMFHIEGVTPEARSLEVATGSEREVRSIDLLPGDLELCYTELNSAPKEQAVHLVSLGNPHFSVSEFQNLVSICHGRKKHPSVSFMITCGRETYARAAKAGYITALESFGAQILTDTCWCMIKSPTIPLSTEIIMTNSAKYAHYGPGLTGKLFYFGDVASCVATACEGSCFTIQQ
jgi:predicted aconitase/predicted aconitase with swiveling domain